MGMFVKLTWLALLSLYYICTFRKVRHGDSVTNPGCCCYYYYDYYVELNNDLCIIYYIFFHPLPQLCCTEPYCMVGVFLGMHCAQHGYNECIILLTLC